MIRIQSMKSGFSLSVLASVLGLSSAFAAKPVMSHEPTAQEIAKATATNEQFIQELTTRSHFESLRDTAAKVHPIWDDANFKYLLINSDHMFNETIVKQTIAQNLPADMKLVVLTPSGREATVKAQFSKWISADRLIIASDPDATDGFWARDAFPVPVASTTDQSISLVNAQYYRNFTAGPTVTKSVGATAVTPNYVFVGGNLLADPDHGRCFVVDSYRLFGINDDLLRTYYGCQDIHHLVHYAGIGDADEVIKPLSGNRMLTSQPQYKADFEAMGYTVTMLPDAGGYRTYVNSVVLGTLVYMPTYGTADDAKAKAVYESLGYKVVGIPTNNLSDNAHGGIHCLTMAYPAIGAPELVRAMGTSIYQ